MLAPQNVCRCWQKGEGCEQDDKDIRVECAGGEQEEGRGQHDTDHDRVRVMAKRWLWSRMIVFMPRDVLISEWIYSPTAVYLILYPIFRWSPCPILILENSPPSPGWVVSGTSNPPREPNAGLDPISSTLPPSLSTSTIISVFTSPTMEITGFAQKSSARSTFTMGYLIGLSRGTFTILTKTWYSQCSYTLRALRQHQTARTK